MKKVAVLQSNYIPWKGYFDIIHDVDLFVFYDEVQYTKNDWRNRNKIKTQNDTKWLTIPCGYDLDRKIYEVKIKQEIPWQEKHYNTLVNNYSKSPYFKKYKEFIDYVYLDKHWEYLYELNRYMIIEISKMLGITTEFADSRDYETSGVKHEKLLNLVKATDADLYLSGLAAKDYIIEEDYGKNNIELVYKDYSGYPEYKQLYEPFRHDVSVLDLLFNTGDDAPYYIWGWRE